MYRIYHPILKFYQMLRVVPRHNPGNISQSDPEFLPDDSYHPIRNSRIPYFGTNVHM